MANPFGDEPTGSAKQQEFGSNPFGDEPKERSTYVGASAKAGGWNALGALATAVDAVLPTTSEADLAVLYKNDPEGLRKMKEQSLNSTYQRAAKNASAKAKAVMAPENLTAGGTESAGKEYATLDPEKAAYLDPAKVAGDVLQSVPSSALMAGTMIATRGAGKTAFAEAKAAGATDAMATAAAARASSQTMAKVGGVGEGTLGGIQNYNQGVADAGEMTDAQWQKSPRYQELVRQGYSPEAAKTLAGEQAATQSGIGAGLADAAINAVGGAVLGKFVGGGKNVGTRVAAAASEQGVTEFGQSPFEKLSENAAKKHLLNPEQSYDEGLLEAAVAGGVVGAASGGPMGLIGHSKESLAKGQKMLDGAAIDLEMEEATGFTSDAIRTTENISGAAAKKPKLNGLQSRVALAAQAAGVDVPTALAVMQLESGGRDVSNPKSSAGGLFQIIDSTWEALGGGDRADEATQIRNGVAYLAQVGSTIKGKVGRPPTPAETYMGHMFGPGGATNLIMANENLPDEPFINTVRKWDSKNADAIVNNNRFTGMTNKQVYDSIATRVVRESQRLGLDAELNRIVQVTPTSDTVPAGLTQEDDALNEELNAMLAEDELSPLTVEEELQAALEEKRLPGGIEDIQEEHRQLDDANPVAEQAQTVEPRLPTELAGAKPRFGFGANNLFDLKFDSDVDKAAYIVANSEQRSGGDSRYLDFLTQETGMTPDEARAYGREIKALIKELARANKDTDVRTLSVATSRTSLPDSYVSADEASTRKRYENPNDRVPISRLPIAAASDPTAVGESLATRKLRTGEVVALNIEGPHTPQPYVEAMQQTVQDWVQRFMPNSAMLLTFRSLPVTRVAQWSAFNKRTSNLISKRNEGGTYIHQLNLRNATNLGNERGSSTNPSAQRKIAYSMAHEFGHALAEEKFKEGMPADLAAKFDNLGMEEFFSEEDLARMPATTASVLREYNDLKRRVLTDPKMTARDFINSWLSPWKTAHGWNGKENAQGAESFAAKYLDRAAAAALDKTSASVLARSMDPGTSILSPHEYMAEQFSRYAYSRSLFKDSPLDTIEFFKGVFEALSKFFKQIKNQKIAEPGTQFAAWVDGLTQTGKAVRNETIPSTEVPAPSRQAKPRVKAKPAVSTPLNESAMAQAAGTPPTQTVTKNIGGRDLTIARDVSSGQWYEVDRAGMMSGPELGTTEAVATGMLARRERVREAEERNARTARSTYKAQQTLAPSLVPRVMEDQVTDETVGWSSEAQANAEYILRNEPMLKELKLQQPELWNELRDLLRAHKLEEFRYEMANYVSDEVAEKIRWDTDNSEHQNMQQTERVIVEALPQSGLKKWFGEGLRKLSDHKWYTQTMTQRAYAMPWSAGMQHFNRMMNEFKTFKARLEFRAVENATRWSKLGKEQRGLLEKAMRAEHFAGEHFFELRQVNKTWRFVPTEQTVAYANKNKLDEDTVKLWMDVKNSYVQHINVLHSAMLEKVKERLRDKPALMKKRVNELAAMFQDIRNTPFLPQTRFGEYAIKIRESGVEGNHIVHVEFFESAAERDAAKAELSKVVNSNQKVLDATYSPSSAILRSLPPQLLTTYAEEMKLTDAQKAEVREIQDAITRNQQTRKYSRQLAMISGANKNLLQNYADFMAHDSNNIAKFYYRSRFNDAINQLRKEREEMVEEGDTAGVDEHGKAINFAESYKDHILNPAAEFHMLRSLVVLKMLWGNIKTALANLNSLTQLYALASRQGQLISSGQMTAKVLSQSITNLGKRVLRQPVEGGQVFTPQERWALNKAKVNGLLDETFAAQLASFSGNSTLDRLNAGGVSEMIDKVTKFGMIPQHAVENFTRRVTLLQQFNTYVKEGMSQEAAFDAAQNDLFLLQGNNTQANRPAFMRGKASLFFIFYGYTQNMLYLMTGAQERSRNAREAIATVPGLEKGDEKRYAKIKWNGETVKMWMGYAALGGLMGLPGAEDMDKILGLVARKFFGADFSLKDYAYALGNAISQQAGKIGLDVNPRSIVHGNMSDINMFGLLPSVDVSPSMSLGNALPGMGGVDKLDKRGGGGDFLISALGPFGSLFKDLEKAFSDDPSMMNRAGLIMPNTVKAWVKAYQEHREGVLYPSGGKVTFDRKTGEIRDLTTGESLSRVMGFTPSIISSNKELHWMQKDKADYWTGRRNQLTAQMWEARKQGDREAEADVRAKIAEFNETADPALRMTTKDLNASMKKREANRRRDENRESAAKRYKGMYKEMEQEFRGN